MDKQTEIQDRILEKLQFAESREWINLYFDLAKEILQVTGLKNEDPRLSISLSPKNGRWFFPVNINNRYVIAMRRGEKVDKQVRWGVGMIFSSYVNDLLQLENSINIRKWGHFDNLPGEKTTPPSYLTFDNIYEVVSLLNSSEPVKKCWHDALFAEVNRAKASPFRKFHQPEVYRFVMDDNFRNEILDRKFKQHENGQNIFPEEIDDSNHYFEGAVKSIQVNAYERNSQVRNLCIKEYGVKCSVCGMTFEIRYGDIGKDFIHVHHLRPLSEVGGKNEVDPKKDMRPVCPNCHAMLHMKTPPYTIEELKQKIMLNCKG
jgi:5-methylcytosine-specific restriction protein A